MVVSVGCGLPVVAPGNEPTFAVIGNPVPPLGVASCEVVEGGGVALGGVAFVNGDAGRGVGSGGLEEGGGGVLGLGGRCTWGDFSGRGGWGAKRKGNLGSSYIHISPACHRATRHTGQ